MNPLPIIKKRARNSLTKFWAASTQSRELYAVYQLRLKTEVSLSRNVGLVAIVGCGVTGRHLAKSIRLIPGGLNVEWDLRLSGDGYQLEARPLENVVFRSKRQGAGRRMDTPLANGTKPGLLDQACAFVDAATQGIPAPFPASNLADHARTLALVETLSRLPSQ